MNGEADYGREQKTLSDWVKDFRIKKIQMKRRQRQGGANLRVCAILSTALQSAEKELRQKQQERFNRWSELQSKLMKKENNNDVSCWSRCVTSGVSVNSSRNEEAEEQRRNEISELWKHEINSLDEFMRNMSNQRRQVAAAS